MGVLRERRREVADRSEEGLGVKETAMGGLGVKETAMGGGTGTEGDCERRAGGGTGGECDREWVF